MRGVVLDFETADRITLATMKEQLGYLREEVRSHTEEGSYMHPEDYHNSMTKLIPSLETLIEYFGGSCE
jgi:hypothetical protein